MPTVVLQNKTPLGITLPIKNGGIGFFEQTFDTFDQIKTNIINVLRTVPGERRMQPLFGCRLYNIVFEQNNKILPEHIKNIITEDITNWVSNVTVNSVDVSFYKNENATNTDMYRIYVAVDFTVNTINKSDTVELVVNTNRI